MKFRDKILSDLAEASCRSLSRKVIRSLIKMTDGMQSGDDGSLKNIWDEICVQVQGEQSVVWDSYLDTIESLIFREVAQLDETTKQLIWLQTDEGSYWSADNDEKEDKEVPIACDDVVQYILNSFVLSAAADWTNRRIEKYLERVID